MILFLLNQRDGLNLITATSEKMAIATNETSRTESISPSLTAPIWKICGQGEGQENYFITLEVKLNNILGSVKKI